MRCKFLLPICLDLTPVMLCPTKPMSQMPRRHCCLVCIKRQLSMPTCDNLSSIMRTCARMRCTSKWSYSAETRSCNIDAAQHGTLRTAFLASLARLCGSAFPLKGLGRSERSEATFLALFAAVPTSLWTCVKPNQQEHIKSK